MAYCKATPSPSASAVSVLALEQLSAPVVKGLNKRCSIFYVNSKNIRKIKIKPFLTKLWPVLQIMILGKI
jgi:hypothetical protein